MLRWGLVTTVKAPEEQILAFVAHHLSLGAEQLWLFFDDPQDPAFPRISRLPKVKAIRCTDFYWLFRGGRHSKHDKRQIANARYAISRCRLDWLGNIDIDEFLHTPRPVADILAEVPPHVPNLQMEPFEALYDPDVPDDIFTARHFRGPLHNEYAPLVPAAFGPSAHLLAKGSLGHTLGKCFMRPRSRGAVMDLHFVMSDRKRLPAPFHPELRMLHFHAQDQAAWRKALPLRISRGAYSGPSEKPLSAFLAKATDQELDAFYRDAMTMTPEKADLLQKHGRLITTDLGLRGKVQQLLAGAYN